MSKKFTRELIKDLTKNLERVDFRSILLDKTPIIFDTNFLFTTFEFNIDVIEEIRRVIGSTYSLYIYEGTILELADVEKRKTKNKKFIPLISKMLDLYDFKVIKSNEKYIDDQILSNISEDIIIATNDKELRLKLWEKQARVLYMRQKKYLEIK